MCANSILVAARTRQLNHRLKGRKQAILDRRATASPAPPIRPSSPSNVALMNGAPVPPPGPNVTSMVQPSQSSPGGFVAVNARSHHDQNGNGASPSTRHELMTKFHTLSDRRASVQPTNTANDSRRPSVGLPPPSLSAPPLPGPSKPPPKPAEPTAPAAARSASFAEPDFQHMINTQVPIPNTPSSLLPAASQRVNPPQDKDDGGPFKAEMVHRMETLAKGERILPPCDRCRRLHMDCLKNLTACMGCTKKHAKCSWREVREAELRGSFSHLVERGGVQHSEGEDMESHRERGSTGSPGAPASPPRQNMAAIAKPSQDPAGQHPQHQFAPDIRVMSSRVSPPAPAPDRDKDRGVEAQLQEAARSSLAAHAHAHAHLGAADGKGAEYQTMVA
jgi:hypothetical protein